MLEAVAALGAGFLLAFLLGGPSASAKRRQIEEAARKIQAGEQLPAADLTVVAADGTVPPAPMQPPPPPVLVPHKATQTAHRYRER